MSLAQVASSSALDHVWEGILPLPLTPMEAFLLADARPGYSLMADVQLHLRGVLDRELFESALTTATSRNPLFRSLVTRDEHLGQVWLPTDTMPAIDWAEADTPLGERYDELIDLTRQIGLRVWVRQGADDATVLLHFHHACCDALGCFAFIEDLLAAYATLCPEGAAVPLRPLDPTRLKRRGLASIPTRKWWQSIFDLVFGAREAWRFFFRAPTPLTSPSCADASDHPTARAEMLTQSLGREVTAKLRARATSAGVSVNDLLLCSMFATMRQWNAGQGPAQRRGWLRILMPQNLREPADTAAPSANIMSFAFLTRRWKECVVNDALIKSVHAETEAIRRGRLSAFFLGNLAIALAAGVLEKMLASRFCFATVVISNFGMPSRRFVARFPHGPDGLIAGNVVFLGLTGVPPTRPRTRAAFAVVNDAQNMTISLKADPAHLTPIDAARLLGEYVSQVAATATQNVAGGGCR